MEVAQVVAVEDQASWRLAFGKRLRWLRTRNRVLGEKMTQKAAAERLGVSEEAFARWERGQNLPSFFELSALADQFKTTTDFLLGRSRTPCGFTRRAGAVTWQELVVDPSPEVEKAQRCYALAARGKNSCEIAEKLGLSIGQSDAEVLRLIGDAVYGNHILLREVRPSRKRSKDLKKAIESELGFFSGDESCLRVYVVKLGKAPKIFREDALGFLASRFLIRYREVNYVSMVGIVGGFLVSRMAYNIRRGEITDLILHPCTVHSLYGAVGVNSSNLVGHQVYLGTDYNVQGVHLSAADRNEMDFNLERASKCDVIFLGVGSMTDESGKQHSTLLDQYKLNLNLLRKKGAIGDILGYPFNGKGELVEPDGISKQRRSVHPDALKELVEWGKPVVAIVSGAEKARQLLGVLRGGFVNTIIIDDLLADALLDLLGKKAPPKKARRIR